MKLGDLVRVKGSLFSTYSRQGQVGVIVRVPPSSWLGTLPNAMPGEGFLILWPDGISLFGRPDHLEIINSL